MRLSALCLAILSCTACDGAAANQPQPSVSAATGEVQPPPEPTSPTPLPTPSDDPSGGEVQAAPAQHKRCGGIAGFKCPDAMHCVDDPNDDCSPKKGGADCMGVCVKDDCDQAGRAYRSREPSECARIKFGCGEGLAHFSDSCGCGCINPAG